MIKIENLSKKFNNKIIFNSINLEIPSNKITFIVGKSGIGKTTLINLIAGFTKKDSGKISFFKMVMKLKILWWTLFFKILIW
ncbi:ATP-binding cassette domain-containing protein [Mesomycoplasma ovipneumoniae]